ncbi:type II toxin-antitoxin system VapC family toxin [Olivibacter sitiensis]|uniref:type II toxin-antitoxin system VapC family toxin n=1 Tax=Olivibacter sitiensis TaxID=376470 RepID=UPI00041B5D42|nr:type II toxin-antitoxin system VapC family toxin [Olivibacter sitiensis]
MAFKVFLDANVLLDFVLRREGYEQGKTIILHAEQKKIVAFVSPTVVQICSYWIAKAYGVSKTKEIMSTLLSFINIIDTPHEQVLTAIHSSMDDIEDALLYYTALHHRLDYVISSDQGFQKAALPSLPVISPIDFVARFQ